MRGRLRPLRDRRLVAGAVAVALALVVTIAVAPWPSGPSHPPKAQTVADAKRSAGCADVLVVGRRRQRPAPVGGPHVRPHRRHRRTTGGEAGARPRAHRLGRPRPVVDPQGDRGPPAPVPPRPAHRPGRLAAGRPGLASARSSPVSRRPSPSSPTAAPAAPSGRCCSSATPRARRSCTGCSTGSRRPAGSPTWSAACWSPTPTGACARSRARWSGAPAAPRQPTRPLPGVPERPSRRPVPAGVLRRLVGLHPGRPDLPPVAGDGPRLAGGLAGRRPPPVAAARRRATPPGASWPCGRCRRCVTRSSRRPSARRCASSSAWPRARPAGAQWSDATGLPPGVSLSPTGRAGGHARPGPARSPSAYQTKGTDPATGGHTGTVLMKVTPSSLSLSAGGQASCLTRSDGTARCWGRNNFGQLGDGTVTGPPRADQGARHRLGHHQHERQHAPAAVKADGTLWCWGLDNFGQVGIGRGAPVRSPHQVGAVNDVGRGRDGVQPHLRDPDRRHAVVLGAEPPRPAGARHRRPPARQAAARRHAHRLEVGDDRRLAHVRADRERDGVLLGRERLRRARRRHDRHPQPPDPGRGRHDVAPAERRLGRRPAASRRPAGCCAGASTGRASSATATPRTRAHPVAVVGDQVWTQVATGDGSTCGVDSVGQLWCWGDNRYGQLGRPPSVPSPRRPTLMPTLDGPVSLASAGWLHTCTIPVGQPFVCWGNDEVGELGDGAPSPAAGPAARRSGTRCAFPALPGAALPRPRRPRARSSRAGWRRGRWPSTAARRAAPCPSRRSR